MTQADIEKTLNYQLAQYVASNPIAVSYPGVSYNPITGTSYLKIDFLHGDTFQPVLGSSSPNRAVGVYQITINIQGNSGTSEVSTILSGLKEYFKTGTGIIRGSNSVRITNFYLGGVVDSSDWYKQVVNISFRSDIQN